MVYFKETNLTKPKVFWSSQNLKRDAAFAQDKVLDKTFLQNISTHAFMPML
jgi:hypothetical protein